MNKFVYLSVTPEALIGSMLPPAEFGAYMATGTKKSNKGQMIFFEVDLDQISGLIDMEYLNRRCVPKEDGSPKHSVYLSVYRVLETIPLKALKSLYLTTDNGVVLELKQTPYDFKNEDRSAFHLYQELCPVTPQVVSVHSPYNFLKSLTDCSLEIKLPKLFFVELKLGELSANPAHGSAEHLPYKHVSHLRDCLLSLGTDDKKMKTVVRFYNGSLLYRTIESGFYVGCREEMIYYRYPTMAELEDLNYEFLVTL